MLAHVVPLFQHRLRQLFSSMASNTPLSPPPPFPSTPSPHANRSSRFGFYGGFYPGVQFSITPNAHLSSLFADEHCGEGTKLILYMQPGSVLARSFTSKDTHTPRGELLVVYGDARKSYRDAVIARETAAVRASPPLSPSDVAPSVRKQYQ